MGYSGEEQNTILLEGIDPKELKEAVAYFHSVEEYGWGSDPTEDWTDEEVILHYREALRREIDAGDIDLSDIDGINIGNEQVT